MSDVMTYTGEVYLVLGIVWAACVIALVYYVAESFVKARRK